MRENLESTEIEKNVLTGKMKEITALKNKKDVDIERMKEKIVSKNKSGVVLSGSFLKSWDF